MYSFSRHVGHYLCHSCDKVVGKDKGALLQHDRKEHGGRGESQLAGVEGFGEADEEARTLAELVASEFEDVSKSTPGQQIKGLLTHTGFQCRSDGCFAVFKTESSARTHGAACRGTPPPRGATCQQVVVQHWLKRRVVWVEEEPSADSEHDTAQVVGAGLSAVVDRSGTVFMQAQRLAALPTSGDRLDYRMREALDIALGVRTYIYSCAGEN